MLWLDNNKLIVFNIYEYHHEAITFYWRVIWHQCIEANSGLCSHFILPYCYCYYHAYVMFYWPRLNIYIPSIINVYDSTTRQIKYCENLMTRFFQSYLVYIFIFFRTYLNLLSYMKLPRSWPPRQQKTTSCVPIQVHKKFKI